MKRLSLKIRQLDDGRFFVRYAWGYWEWTIHRAYFKDMEELTSFLKEITTKTWRG